MAGWIRRFLVPVFRGGGAAWFTWLPAASLCFLLAFPSVCLPFPAEDSGKPLSAFTLRFENDAANSTDANYTAGLAVGYTRHDSGLLGWLWGHLGVSDGRRYSSYELAQLLYTPWDLNRVPPDPDDRPYAGLTIGGMTTGLQSGNELQAIKLLVGVVGPAALGEAGQNLSHKVLGNERARGWDYQLDDEPLVNLLYEYRRRYRLAGTGNGVAAEIIPIGTAMLGNYLTKVHAEAQLRIGINLPDDFGETTIRGLGALPLPENGTAAGETGMYVFTGAGGDLVVRDITLDGNSFRSGPSVDKEPFVSSALVGLAYRSGRFLASFSYILCGREFGGQGDGEKYGSISLTYLFR